MAIQPEGKINNGDGTWTFVSSTGEKSVPFHESLYDRDPVLKSKFDSLPDVTPPPQQGFASMSSSTPTYSNKYVGGGLGQFAKDMSKYKTGLVPPDATDLAKIRADATAYPPFPGAQELPGGGYDFAGTTPQTGGQLIDNTGIEMSPITEPRDDGNIPGGGFHLTYDKSTVEPQETRGPMFASDQELIESQLRTQEYERVESEKTRKLELLGQEEQISQLQEDVKNYNVDPGYFWSGRRVKVKTIRTPQLGGDGKPLKGGKTYEKDIYETRGGHNVATKLGLIISAGLLSYASAKLGRDPSAGINMINGFIDRNIELQKMELGRRTGLARDKVNLLGEMRSKFRDERAAELQTRAALKGSMAHEMGKIQSRVDDATKQQQLDGFQFSLKRGLKQDEIEAKKLEFAARKANAEMSNANTYRNQQMEAARLAAAKKQVDDRVPGMTRTKEMTPTPRQTLEMSRGRGKTVNILKTIETLIKHVNKNDATFWGTAADTIGKSLAASIMFDLKSAEFKNLGAALTETEKKPLNTMVPEDPGGIWTAGWGSPMGGTTVAALEELRRQVKIYHALSARQRGYREDEFGDIKGQEQS